MKRTAGAFVLLASLGGCMHADRQPTQQTPPQQTRPTIQKPSPYQGPYGEPIGPGNNPASGMSPGMAPMGYFSGNNPRPGTDLTKCGYLDTSTDADSGVKQAHFDTMSAQGPGAQGPGGYPFHGLNHGIVPVPPGGPPGAVALIPGVVPGGMPQQLVNMRTSVNFASPDGMRVTWYGPNGWNDQPLVTPARYNFLEGGVYRLRMSSVANRLEKVYYPTLEVVPAQEKTVTYLAHSSVPVTFTDEDFEQVDSGNFLVKVVYLPDPHNQDLAVAAGPNELVSTRLEPGIDPIVEAQRRGTILLIVRMGNIDLAVPNSPAMDAPNPYMMRPPMGMPIPAEKKDVKPSIPIPLPKSAAPEEKADDKKPAVLPTIP